MYKLCKTEQSANRQRRLEEGLLEAMCSCQYEEISISELCQRMGIPRKSFYRYFSGKDGALHALIDHTLMRYDSRDIFYSTQVHLAARQELENYFRFWREQKPLLDALARSKLSGVLLERTIQYALTEAGFRKSTSLMGALGAREYTVVFAISGLMTMVVQWHHCGYNVPVEQLAAMAAQVLTKPLVPQA